MIHHFGIRIGVRVHSDLAGGGGGDFLARKKIRNARKVIKKKERKEKLFTISLVMKRALFQEKPSMPYALHRPFHWENRKLEKSYSIALFENINYHVTLLFKINFYTYQRGFWLLCTCPIECYKDSFGMFRSLRHISNS